MRMKMFFCVLSSIIFITVMSSTALLAAPLNVEIIPEYSEFFTGEVVRIRLKVANTNDQPYRLINLDKLRAYGGVDGALHFEIFDASGKLIRTRPTSDRRAALGVRNEDWLEMAVGASLESMDYLQVTLETPGIHRVRVTFRPQLTEGPEILREFRVNVVSSETAIVEKKVIPDADATDNVRWSEILKARTKDGYWLCVRGKLPTQLLGRLAQVNENTTFSVSVADPSPDERTKQIVVAHQTDGEEHTVKVPFD